MGLVNHHRREINFKIVYYGAGLCGKTTSLQFLHGSLNPETRGPMVMLPTATDRTLYFDFLPLKLPKLRGYATRVHLYTVPGQVHYNSTRKLVLSGADGVVFVVDSHRSRLEANQESLQNLGDNLREQQLSLDRLPWIMQYNKRDLPTALPVSELEHKLNPNRIQAFETVATRGDGVLEALKAIVRLVLVNYSNQAAAAARDAPPRGAGGRVWPATPSEDATAVVAVTSLSEVIESFTSGVAAAEKHQAPSWSLGTLVRSPTVAQAIALVERHIVQGSWKAAVRAAANACHELAVSSAGILADTEGQHSLAMSAYLLGVSPARFLHFREVQRRVDTEEAVTSGDAIFALFFLADLALRAEEPGRQSKPSEADQS